MDSFETILWRISFNGSDADLLHVGAPTEQQALEIAREHFVLDDDFTIEAVDETLACIAPLCA